MQGGGVGLEQIFFLVAGIIMFAFAAKRLMGRQKSWEKPDPHDPVLEEVKREREAAKREAELVAKEAAEAESAEDANASPSE